MQLPYYAQHSSLIINKFANQCFTYCTNSLVMLCNTLNNDKTTKFFLKNLFNNKIYNTFTFSNNTYSYGTHSSTLIKDNTPSRLAAMQHTWEVFSFYSLTKCQKCYANV